MVAMTATASGQDDPLRRSEMDDPGMISGAGTLPLDGLDVWSTFRPRFSFVYDAGKGIGYQNSFTSLEVFVPLAQPTSDRLWYADFRGLFNKDGASGGNLGVGRRLWDPAFDATFGLHLYYDYRQTAANQFQQLSPGFDILTDCWEFRVNGYLPLVFDDRKPPPDQFRGHVLYIDRFETALSGMDMELGVPIPLCDRFQPKLLGSVYSFDGPAHDRFWGWRARVEGQVSEAVSLHLSVQDDPLFDTTVNFAVAVRFPGGALMRQRPLARLVEGLLSYPFRRRADERLAADVYRLQNVVVDDTEGTLARDPATGQPLRWLHVAAGGNSDGSFEDPYATLTQALTDPRYQSGNINGIYVRSGFQQTVTHTGDFSLVDNTVLLSNGPVQVIDTQLGPRMLPYSGNDPDLLGLPIIDGQIAMGNGTTLSGFQVQSPVGPGVVALANDGFVISENAIVSAPTDGILLSQISGTGAVSGNRITDSGLNGVRIVDCPAFSGDIVDNNIRRSNSSGLLIQTTSDFQGVIKNNEIADNRLSGIAVIDSTMTGDVTGNRLLDNDQDGLGIFQSTYSGSIRQNTIDHNDISGIALIDTVFDGQIVNNTIAGNFQGTFTPAELSRIFRVNSTTKKLEIAYDPTKRGFAGIDIFGTASVTNAQIRSNKISNFESSGVSVVTSDFATFQGEISDNEIDATLFGALLRADNAIMPVEVDLRRNTVTNSQGGILLDGTTNAASGAVLASVPFKSDIDANTVNNLAKFGIRADAAAFEGNITNNIANENGYAGIEVNCTGYPPTFDFGDFKGRVSGNTANGTKVIGIAGGVGIWVSAANTIQGDSNNDLLTDNEASDNQDSGIGLYPSGSMSGNITGNRTERNAQAGILFSADRDYRGRIANNTANENGGGGIVGELQGIGGPARDWIGDVAGNTTNNNAPVGLSITLNSARFTGNISDNVANGNGRAIIPDPDHPSGVSPPDSGIVISGDLGDPSAPATIVGNIQNNRASNNGRSGISVGLHSWAYEFAPVSVTGNVIGNVANSNARQGIELAGGLAGDFAGNSMSNNSTPGLKIQTAIGSDINMHDNQFSANNTNGNEAIVHNSGSATLNLSLQNNTSLNSNPGLDDPNNPPFNYDVLNTGAGTLNISPANVNGLNTGTVGSSDGSVVIP